MPFNDLPFMTAALLQRVKQALRDFGAYYDPNDCTLRNADGTSRRQLDASVAGVLLRYYLEGDERTARVGMDGSPIYTRFQLDVRKVANNPPDAEFRAWLDERTKPRRA
jgi:hypothetical protein